jgi:hypothetical protein
MRTIIKLIVVAIVLNAVFQGTREAWRYYQLKDAAQQALIFGGGATMSQLHAQILGKATELALPLEPQNLAIRRTGQQTVAEARYTQPVELFPNYDYPVDLSFTVDAIAATPVRADEPIR